MLNSAQLNLIRKKKKKEVYAQFIDWMTFQSFTISVTNHEQVLNSGLCAYSLRTVLLRTVYGSDNFL